MRLGDYLLYIHNVTLSTESFNEFLNEIPLTSGRGTMVLRSHVAGIRSFAALQSLQGTF